ncbi:MAG TPA: hypothetical protein VF651_00600 [Gammaproteobacteria bacterium]
MSGGHRPWLWPGALALLVIAFLACCWGFLQSHYITNDNFGIVEFAKLGYPVPYIGAPFTSLLHLLYTAWPGAAWYPLALYAAHAASLFLWLWLLWRTCRSPWLWAPLALVVFAYYVRCLVFLDYTSAAALLCASALTWLGVEVREGEAVRLRALVAGLLFACGLLIRPQVPLGVLAYSACFGLWVLALTLRESKTRPAVRRLAFTGLIFLVPVLATHVADLGWRHVNRTPLEAQYESFNKLRGHIHRLSRPRKAALMKDRAALRSIHWTRRDLAYLYNWYFLDERTYTVQALQVLLDAAPAPRLSLREAAGTFAQKADWRNPYVLLVFASLPLWLVLLRRSRLNLIGALAPLWCLGIGTAMSLFFGFLPRVEFTFELGVGLLGLVLAVQALRHFPAGRFERLALACSLALALCGGSKAALQTLHGYQKAATAARNAQVEIDGLNRDFAGATIVIQARQGFLEALDPRHPPAMDFNLIQLGWTTYSPKFYDDLHRLGIEQPHQLVDALISRQDAYLLGLPGWPQNLLTYSERADRHKIKVRALRRFPNGTALSRYEAPPGDAAAQR